MEITLIILVIVGLYFIWNTGKPQITGQELSELKKEKVILIDVRTEAEFNSFHIEGAVSIPLRELDDKIGALVPDRNTPVFLYCQSGARSASATNVLKQLGYHRAINLGSLANAKSMWNKSEQR